VRAAQAVLTNADNHDPSTVAAARAFLTAAYAEAGGAQQ